MMKNISIIGPVGIATILSWGCVMKSTYDAAITDLDTTRAELESATAQKQALTQEVTRLERITSETTREAEMAAAAVQRARDDAEADRKAGEERIAKLMRTISQFVTAQGALLKSLHAAQEDTRALKSTVEMYKARLGAADGPRIPSFPPQSAAIDRPAQVSGEPPQATPVPAEPSPNQAAAPAVTPDPIPAAKPAAPPAPAPTSPAADEGWLSSIKGWLMSIWRSVFS